MEITPNLTNLVFTLSISSDATGDDVIQLFKKQLIKCYYRCFSHLSTPKLEGTKISLDFFTCDTHFRILNKKQSHTAPLYRLKLHIDRLIRPKVVKEFDDGTKAVNAIMELMHYEMYIGECRATGMTDDEWDAARIRGLRTALEEENDKELCTGKRCVKLRNEIKRRRTDDS